MHLFKGFTATLVLSSSTVIAEEAFKPTLNTFGVTGLIDTPTAESQPDAELNTTVSYFSGGLRNTLTFQIFPRLSGSFRYTKIDNFSLGGNRAIFDRSFDLKYQILEEKKYTPSLAIGFQDFIGTSIYSGEYLVGTKNISSRIKISGGIGWGRFGGERGFDSRNLNFGTGGSVDASNFFKGPVDFFGGIEWKTPVKGLNLKIEKSSDAYVAETIRRNIFTRNSQINFGLDYKISKSVNLSAYYLYGSEFGAQVTFALNPKRSDNPSGLEPASLPVLTRPTLKHGQSYDTTWATADSTTKLRKPVSDILKVNQIKLEALKVSATSATVYIQNKTYGYEAQAIGRTARALTRVLPPSVETLTIIPVSDGLPLQTITVRRSDIEKYEHDPAGAERQQVRTKIRNASTVDKDVVYVEGLYPKFEWSIKPALRNSLFDPDDPVRLEVGLRARASYKFAPGLSVSGAVLKPLIGNIDNITRQANSVLPNVRTLTSQFLREGDPALERLTADYLFKMAPDVYGRASAGLLETQFGGISGEVLWRPYNRSFAIGAELNYVKQRNFNQLFDFQDYSVATGHVSVYRDLFSGFTAQVDAGRYLAGDWGGTLSVNRTFKNGWKIGAFMTLTDVPFAEFGEGSFDKGLILSAPLASIFGNSSRRTADLTIRPVLRDGGARLRVENRLFDVTDGYDKSDIDSTFGRFWR